MLKYVAVTTASILLAGLQPVYSAEITVAGYGGSFEKLMREEILPPFEQSNNVTVNYVAGQSTATLAKIQASKGTGQIDVAIVDDGPMYQAVQYGFCEKLDENPVYDELFPIAKLGDSAVGINLGMTGIVYNTELFEKRGLPVPKSWADLSNPAYKGQIALLGASSTTGIHGLVMVAKANGGGEADIEPGFKVFAEQLRDNVLTFPPSAAKLEELLQSQEVAIGIIADTRVASLKKAGLPVKMVDAAEGSPVIMTTGCVVKDSKESALAQKFMQYIVSNDVQTIFSNNGNPPVNNTVELSATQKAAMPANSEAIDSLVALDWVKINENRANWINRWNREIEK